MFLAFYPQAVRTAYLVTGDRDLAEDAAQAAFWRVWRARARFRAGAAFAPWLYRIVLNEARRLRPRAWGQPAPEPTLAEGEADAADLEAIRRWDRQRLRAVIRDLPLHQRAPLVLMYFTGLREAEIAEVLGIPPGTVKSRLHAARARLLRALEDDRA